jgi:hypothetical protein
MRTASSQRRSEYADESNPKFLEWQAEYASKNIATFPVSITAEGKKPLVSHYQHIGLPASAQIARRFANARGIGFIAGSRTTASPSSISMRPATSRYREHWIGTVKHRSLCAQPLENTMRGFVTTANAAQCGQNLAMRSTSLVAVWLLRRLRMD